MKQKILLCFVLILITICRAQQNVLQISVPQSGNVTNAACKEVKLKAGYHYAATPGNQMRTYVDPNLMCAVNYVGSFNNNISNGNIPPVNTNNEVGNFSGSFAVTENGAATYQIPLELPPGTAGVVPNLSIVYNSYGGDGILGMGWQLNGLSVISRVNKTVYHDGKSEGIALNNNDAFALDGMRLFPLSGTNGGVGTIYGAEVENFAIIQSLYNSNLQTIYFTVQLKNGTIMEYGNSPDSYIDNSNQVPLMWLLNKVQDINGNYYTIHYTKIKNNNEIEYRPDYIEYTGNSVSGLAPYNKVKFLYNKRNDNTIYYVSGVKFTNQALLTEIQVLSDNKLVRRYECNYSLNYFGNSQLSEIKIQGSDGKYLNSIKFVWEKNNVQNNLTYTSFSSDAGNYVGLFYKYDFNKDGYDDVIRIISGYAELYINNKNYTFSLVYSLYVDNYSGYDISNKTNVIADFNGDGVPDILLYKGNATSILGQELGGNEFKVLTYSNNILTEIKYVSFPDYSDSKFTVGDFDGDGATDLVVFFYNEDIAFFHSFKKNITSNSTLLGDNTVNLYPVNFDGDSKDEILYTSLQSIISNYVYEINQLNQLVMANSNSSLLYPTGWHRVYLGDFNGDRNTDLLTWSSGGGWEVALSKSNKKEFDLYSTFRYGPLPVNNGDPSAQPPVYNRHYYFVSDFNNDGKSDILDVATNLTDNSDTYFELFISNGKEFVKYWYHTNIPLKEIISNMVGDFNGDGKTDVMLLQHHYANWYLYQPFYGEADNNKITDIFDGFNLHTNISYRSITSLKNMAVNPQYVMNNNVNVSFPVIKLYNTLKVVCETKVDDNKFPFPTTFSKYNYFYSDAVAHVQGKGFLGFLTFEKRDVLRNMAEKTFFNIPSSSNFFTPTTQKTEKFLTSPYTLLAREEVDNYTFLTGSSLPNGADPLNTRHFIYPSQSTSYDLLTNFKTITYTQMDNFGNVTSTSTEYYDDNNSLVETRQTLNAYSAFCYPYNNKLTNSTTIITRTGEQAYSRSVNYNYYPPSQNCLLQNTTDDKGVMTAYEYDIFGNVTKTKISGPTIGSNYIINQVFYDSKGRFPVKTINTLGHVIEKTYDDFGNLTSEKDPNGLITTYEYDGFNRVTKITHPDNVIEQIIRSWETGNTTIPAALYSIKKISTVDNNYSKEYFNLIGLSLRTESLMFNGSVLYKDKNYNSLWLLDNETMPYKVGTSANLIPKTYYQYDNLLRVQKIIHYNGSFTEYQYNGKTTVTDFGDNNTNQIINTTSKTIDPTGKTISSTDDAGTVTYEYFSNGQTKKITTPNNHIVTMQYDNFGRQTQLNDPDAGTMTYNYDELDRLISQTDAQNHTYTMTYDPLNRITGKTGPEGTVTYQYDSKPNGIGKLSSITGFNNIHADFNYDNLSRLQSKTEAVNNQNYTYQYSYDSKGRLFQFTFPSGFSLKYEYNNFGYQHKIFNNTNNSLIWEALNRNNLDQITQCNVLQFNQNFSYTNTGLIQTENYSYLYYPPTFSNYYSYDPIRNNILTRISSFPPYAIKEEYQYDIMDRLKITDTYTNTPGGYAYMNHTEITYDPAGNILHKTDVGDYLYDPTKTHAVKQINNPATDLLSKPTQNITYTPFLQPDKITEGTYELQYTYAYDHQRRISELKQNNTLVKKIIYGDDYEEISTSATTYSVHYVYSPDRLAAIVVKYDSAGTQYEQVYGVITDIQGNIMGLFNTQGNIVYTINYDAWGRERNATDASYTNIISPPVWLIRGYTEHEHLREFGLINMNGRLYDPQIARMLSPDNFVQDATSTQGFNRYSYVLNNPLKYKDPSGEIAGAALWGLAFIGGGLSNWTNGYSNPFRMSFNEANNLVHDIGQVGQFTIYQDKNTKITAGLNVLALGISVDITQQNGNFTSNFSAGYSIMGVPFVNVGASYSEGDWTIGAGVGISGNGYFFGGSLTYKGYGISYAYNHYWAGTVPQGGQFVGAQNTGAFTFLWPNGSFRIENDFLAFQDQDRWRTSAWELSGGNFSVGSYIYTNDPQNEKSKKDLQGTDWFGNLNNPEKGRGAWEQGFVYRSPLWFGYKEGNSISRIGFSHPLIQDRTQNVVHKYFPPGYQQFYNKYTPSVYGVYGYSGYYSPFNLYER